MSKPDIWMPWFIGSYLADTMHLTTEQHGAYDLLLMHGWKNHGKIPGDDRQLAQIAKLTVAKWRSAKPVILPFFTVGQDPELGAYWFQKRQMEEIQKAAERQEGAEAKAKRAASVRWSKDATSNATSISQELPRHASSSSSSPSSPIGEDPPISPKPKKAGRKPNPKTLIADDWQPAPETLAWCAEQRLPEPDYQRPIFINHFKGKGEARADWDASFRNWMLSPYRKDRNHGQSKHESAAERNGRRFREELGKIAAGIGAAGSDEVLLELPEADAGT